jgi:tetratricopeptide (TPR) repeat protein
MYLWIGLLPLYAVQSYGQTSDTSKADQFYTKSKKFWYNNRDSSLYYLEKVRQLSDQLAYTRGKGYASYGLGWHERKLFKKFQFYTQALEYFEQCHDSFGLGIVLNAIGMVYSEIGNEEKSLEYFLKSIRYKKITKDIGGLAFSHINIGHIYLTKKEFDKALESYQEALIYRLQAKDPLGTGYAQINISQTLNEQEKWPEALKLAKLAQSQFRATHDNTATTWAKQLIGHLQLVMHQSDSAYTTLEPLTKIKGYTQTLLLANLDFAELLEQRKETSRALGILKQCLILKDSLQQNNYRLEVQKIANEYEFLLSQKEKKEQDLREAARLSRRDNMEYLVISVAVLVFFIVVFSGRKLFSKRIMSAMILIGLLLLFEFLLVVSDPIVSKISGTEPSLKLIANVVLAILILPIHTYLEKIGRQKLLTPAATEY